MNQDSSWNMERKGGLTRPITRCVARAASSGYVFAAINSQDALRRTELLAPPCPPSGCCGAQTVKNPPAMQKTRVPSLGWEDPLEEGWQPTPVFLPRKSHGQRRLAGTWGHKESDMTEAAEHTDALQVIFVLSFNPHLVLIVQLSTY